MSVEFPASNDDAISFAQVKLLVRHELLSVLDADRIGEAEDDVLMRELVAVIGHLNDNLPSGLQGEGRKRLVEEVAAETAGLGAARLRTVLKQMRIHQQPARFFNRLSYVAQNPVGGLNDLIATLSRRHTPNHA